MPRLHNTKRTLFQVLFVTMICGASYALGQKSITDDEANVWAKEVAIFEGRAEGDLSYYVNAADEAYLAWPFGLPEPITYETFKDQAANGEGLRGEQLELNKKGLTVQGNTAVSYFRTHRTRLGEAFGTDAERNVDQYYDNIHVWIRNGDDWKIIGGLSRLVDAPQDNTP